MDDEEFNDISLLCDFPCWDELSDEMRRMCYTHRNETLDSEYGLTLYRYASDEKREQLVRQALEQLIAQVASKDDVMICATILYNYLAHKVQCFTRAHGDLNALVWCIADEARAIHRIVDQQMAVNVLKAHLTHLTEIFDRYLLRRCHVGVPIPCRACRYGHPDKCFMRRWNVVDTKRRISFLKRQRDVAKRTMNSAKEDEETREQSRDLFNACSAVIEHYERVLMVRTLILGNNQRVVVAYLGMCSANCETLQGNTVWFPCPDRCDVNLETGETRRRWLSHNVIHTANANYTIPRRLAEKMDPDQWSDEDRNTYFGMVIDLFEKISGHDTTTRQEIIISLYLQLLGHNNHKYLIFWIGNGNNGKTIILGAFRKIMGPLAEALDKSVFFETKGTVSAAHAGYAMQLVDIRSGTIDELSNKDEMKLDMVKRIVSPDVTVCLREAGARRQGSAKNRFHIECSILMSCNDGSFPKFKREPAIMNRFRAIRFGSQFVARELTPAEAASKRFYRADSQLSQRLNDPQVQAQFLNYIIAYGIKYYRSAKALRRELLPPNQATEALATVRSSRRPLEASFGLRRELLPPNEAISSRHRSNCRRPESSFGLSTRHEESPAGSS
ncbi:MAG: hypothetical protein OJI67_01575, partial [Prosthecobacter sp.]|nr:hypothetical protein [Prosthecobacter sp.]